MEQITKRQLKQRWDYKRDSIYNLRDNIKRLKLQVRKDLKSRDEKQRTKLFNLSLKKVALKIGHSPATLKKHYLLPEIEENYYSKGSVTNIKI